MRYFMPCDFYTYKNDRIKIRELLIKEKTLDEFSKMNESDIVDPDNAIIIHYMRCDARHPKYSIYTFSKLSSTHTARNSKGELQDFYENFALKNP